MLPAQEDGEKQHQLFCTHLGIAWHHGLRIVESSHRWINTEMLSRWNQTNYYCNYWSPKDSLCISAQSASFADITRYYAIHARSCRPVASDSLNPRSMNMLAQRYLDFNFWLPVCKAPVQSIWPTRLERPPLRVHWVYWNRGMPAPMMTWRTSPLWCHWFQSVHVNATDMGIWPQTWPQNVATDVMFKI